MTIALPGGGANLDLIYNSGTSLSGMGDAASRILAAPNYDLGVMRPWVSNKDGRSYCSLATGQRDDKGVPLLANYSIPFPATLTKEAWVRLDEAVLRTARPQLKVWNDLVSAGLTYNLPNAMGTIVLQHQVMGDFNEATLSIDGVRQTNRDRPQFDLRSIPIPIVHSDFSFTLRDMILSRQTGAPLDTTGAEQSARRCAEQIEQLTIGTLSSYTFAGGTIYGLTNFPQRLTKVLTLPTSPTWTPNLLISELLDMKQSLENIYFNGPYGIYFSPAWSQYLDNDYSRAYNGDTLRARIGKLDNMSFVRKLDYLEDFQVVMWQLSSDVVRAIQGMGMTTLQWSTHGGMVLNFKVFGIMVPQIRSNASSQTGIAHGVAA